MTCRFDLDCFNTRCFKPYTGQMEVCANYLHESDTEREWELLSSANMLPHLLTCITPATGFLLVNALQHWAALIGSSLTCLMACRLWYDITHVCHPCSLACMLSVGFDQGKKDNPTRAVWRISVHGWQVNWTLSKSQGLDPNFFRLLAAMVAKAARPLKCQSKKWYNA